MKMSRSSLEVFITPWRYMLWSDSPLAYGAGGQVNLWLNVLAQSKERDFFFIYIYVQIFQLASDTRENISHFGPMGVYPVWDRLINLKPKPRPRHSSCCPSFLSDGTCLKRQQRGVHFHPLSLGLLPNVLCNHCSFLRPSHPLSPQPLIPLRIFPANTFRVSPSLHPAAMI